MLAVLHAAEVEALPVALALGEAEEIHVEVAGAIEVAHPQLHVAQPEDVRALADGRRHHAPSMTEGAARRQYHLIRLIPPPSFRPVGPPARP
jgi:hypothetical protein